MGFKDKAYGLNPLVIFELQIELEEHRVKGRALFFWCKNKTLTLCIGAYGTLKIVKNGIKLKRLWSPKVEGVNNSTKQTSKCYKGWFLNTQNIPCVLFFCY
jgi:hypothetical protein